VLFLTVLILTESSQFHLLRLTFCALIDDLNESILFLNTLFMGRTCKIGGGESCYIYSKCSY